MEEIVVIADIEQLNTLTEFVNKKIEAYYAPKELEFQIAIVIDEIFTNIASYAYPSGSGNAKLSVDVDEKAKIFKLVFIDNGIAFNPLEHQDPDVSLKIEDRKIGGLGIFMVKKIMDKVSYTRENEQNILTLEMVWPYKLKQ